jgi:hypothetical protein
LPIPTAWLPWPGKTNAIVIGYYFPLRNHDTRKAGAKNTAMALMSRRSRPAGQTTNSGQDALCERAYVVALPFQIGRV